MEKIEEEIKAKASEYQIDGEFVTLSLAEKPESLARIGLQKEYHTIVAVGSDALINAVAEGLIHQEAVLGAVPLQENSIFLPLIGVRNWQEAVEVLPQRKVRQLDTILLNREVRFLTQVEILPPSGKQGIIVLAFDGFYRAEVSERRIVVSNLGINLSSPFDIFASATDGFMDVFIPGKTEVKRGILGWFRRLSKEEEQGGSIFHPRRLEVNSRLKLKAYINQKAVATVPFLFEVEPRSLNFIVKRQSQPQTNQ